MWCFLVINQWKKENLQHSVAQHPLVTALRDIYGNLAVLFYQIIYSNIPLFQVGLTMARVCHVQQLLLVVLTAKNQPLLCKCIVSRSYQYFIILVVLSNSNPWLSFQFFIMSGNFKKQSTCLKWSKGTSY